MLILVIVLSLAGYTGHTSNLSVASCTDSYYTKKYTQTELLLSVAFYAAVLSLILTVMLSLLLIIPIIKRTNVAHARCKVLDLLATLYVLAQIIIFGRALTLQIDLNAQNTCTVTTELRLLNVILGVSAGSGIISLIQFAFMLKADQILQ